MQTKRLLQVMHGELGKALTSRNPVCVCVCVSIFVLGVIDDARHDAYSVGFYSLERIWSTTFSAAVGAI